MLTYCYQHVVYGMIEMFEPFAQSELRVVVFSHQCQQGELESALQLKVSVLFRLDCKVFAFLKIAFYPPAISSLLHLTCHSVYICPFLHFIPLLLNFLSHSPHLTRFISLSVLPTSSALRSCSTGDSLLSSASIRSAKSAPALAPPLPVLLHHHHHHPLLPPLVDQLAGTCSLYYLSAFP